MFCHADVFFRSCVCSAVQQIDRLFWKMVARKGLSSRSSSSPSSWLERLLPEAAMPYAKLARLDKPIGTWLIVWPCFWYVYTLISSTVPPAIHSVCKKGKILKSWMPLLHNRSIAIATRKGEIPDLKMLALFGCGSFILRGLGCTVNDLFDRDIDKKVFFHLTDMLMIL